MGKENYAYLDEERVKLWSEVNDLKKQNEELLQLIEHKTLEDVKEAKESARQTTMYKNRAKNTFSEVEQVLVGLNDLEQKREFLDDLINNFKNDYAVIIESKSEVESIVFEVKKSETAVMDTSVEIEGAISSYNEYINDLETIKNDVAEKYDNTTSLVRKINTSHSTAVTKANELKELYQDIFGYVFEDEETGEEKKYEGKRVELESAYLELKNKVKEYDKSINEFKECQVEAYKLFLSNKNVEFEGLKKEVRKLLPEALTAGLSSAYEEKRKQEEKSKRLSSIGFYISILLLTLVALLPIGVSMYSMLNDGKSLSDIIQNIPKVVCAFIPLYIPALWLAISANKNVKLSKRLIEEYAHKESLSKTFEGLSTQINELNDSSNSTELRVKLLYNIIQASSENPGNLIKGYHRSDNPILDVLDKSLAFSNSMEKLAKVPGLRKVAERIVDSKNKKVEEAVNKAISSDNEKEEKED